MITSTKTLIITIHDSEDNLTYTVHVVNNTIKHLVVHSLDGLAPQAIQFRALPLEVQSEIISNL